MKREVLRHVVATLAYRGGIAVSDAPEGFAVFRVDESVRTPGEILAHIGDLLEGSLYLLKGEMIYLTSSPLPWGEEVSRFFSAVERLDAYLESGAPLACPVERLIQGPIGDAPRLCEKLPNARINPRRAQAFNLYRRKHHEKHAIEASG
jgi:hypothetical protein